jgi:hypothetical protein
VPAVMTRALRWLPYSRPEPPARSVNHGISITPTQSIDICHPVCHFYSFRWALPIIHIFAPDFRILLYLQHSPHPHVPTCSDSFRLHPSTPDPKPTGLQHYLPRLRWRVRNKLSKHEPSITTAAVKTGRCRPELGLCDLRLTMFTDCPGEGSAPTSLSSSNSASYWNICTRLIF